jgi:hypothetical protein
MSDPRHFNLLFVANDTPKIIIRHFVGTPPYSIYTQEIDSLSGPFTLKIVDL